jgi:hypothetical protein
VVVGVRLIAVGAADWILQPVISRESRKMKGQQTRLDIERLSPCFAHSVTLGANGTQLSLNDTVPHGDRGVSRGRDATPSRQTRRTGSPWPKTDAGASLQLRTFHKSLASRIFVHKQSVLPFRNQFRFARRIARSNRAVTRCRSTINLRSSRWPLMVNAGPFSSHVTGGVSIRPRYYPFTSTKRKRHGQQ